MCYTLSWSQRNVWASDLLPVLYWMLQKHPITHSGQEDTFPGQTFAPKKFELPPLAVPCLYPLRLGDLILPEWPCFTVLGAPLPGPVPLKCLFVFEKLTVKDSLFYYSEKLGVNFCLEIDTENVCDNLSLDLAWFQGDFCFSSVPQMVPTAVWGRGLVLLLILVLILFFPQRGYRVSVLSFFVSLFSCWLWIHPWGAL